MEGGQRWASGYNTGVPCGLSSVFNFLLPWSQIELPKYVRWRCIISFACFVIPLYLKQMKDMALKQIDSSWNEKDLYPSECWCRNKWKKNLLVGSWSSLNGSFFFFFYKGRWGFFPLLSVFPFRELCGLGIKWEVGYSVNTHLQRSESRSDVDSEIRPDLWAGQRGPTSGSREGVWVIGLTSLHQKTCQVLWLLHPRRHEDQLKCQVCLLLENTQLTLPLVTPCCQKPQLTIMTSADKYISESRK